MNEIYVGSSYAACPSSNVSSTHSRVGVAYSQDNIVIVTNRASSVTNVPDDDTVRRHHHHRHYYVIAVRDDVRVLLGARGRRAYVRVTCCVSNIERELT
eukprot:1179107-Prorocentrum_minimum.AAC.1